MVKVQGKGNNTVMLTALLAVVLLNPTADAMEPLSDGQLSDIEAQGMLNLKVEDFKFLGTAIDGVAAAGSVNDIAVDNSALLRNNYRFNADAIGTDSNPIRFGAATADATVNTIQDGEVTLNGNDLGTFEYLRIELPERAGWQNVDYRYDAVYRNPDVVDSSNPNIIAGGTPSTEHESFGHITIDDLSIEGSVELTGIPVGHKIRSVYLDDGSRDADTSRQGLMMNVDIKELFVKQWLFEANDSDGLFDPDHDIVINNFRLTNLSMKSATYEMTEKGLRVAYHDPQPFTQDEGALLKSGGGLPDTAHPAYDPTFPKGELTLQTQMTHSLPNESRLRGITMDHLVLNIRND